MAVLSSVFAAVESPVVRRVANVPAVASVAVLLAWVVDLFCAQLVLLGTQLYRHYKGAGVSHSNAGIADSNTGVGNKADFSEIRYSQVWEDTRVLRKALRVKPNDRVLSIASAGDNVFGLLLDDPREVVAIDLSPGQIALCALKICAIRHLSREEMLVLLGFRFFSSSSSSSSSSCSSSFNWAAARIAKYEKLRPHLDAESQIFWDSRRQFIAAGIIHGGRLEWYFRTFATKILPNVRSIEQTHDIFVNRKPEEAQRHFDDEWDGPLWRLAQRMYFSRAMLGIGRDPAFFEHVSADVGSELMIRFRQAMRTIPTSDNFYLEYMMLGDIRGLTTLPDYLTEEGYEVVRQRIDRVTLVLEDMGDYLGKQTSRKDSSAAAFDAYNLSDIFEWMNEQQSESLLRSIVNASRAGARIAYWNLFVPRWRPSSLADCISRDIELAAELKSQDRTFMYGGFQVETVTSKQLD